MLTTTEALAKARAGRAAPRDAARGLEVRKGGRGRAAFKRRGPAVRRAHVDGDVVLEIARVRVFEPFVAELTRRCPQ